MLGNLSDDGAVAQRDFNGVKQGRKLIIRESDIQNGADDLGHGTDVFGHWEFNSFWCSNQASAPATISVISWVMAACLARLYFRLRSAIISSALEVAESMAVRRAACSEAWASHRAP